jgi:histidine triad (HIT) family protein
MDCLFCKIAAGEIPCKKVYEDDEILAFHDISPQAPVHALIIPKAHIASGADEIGADTAAAVGRIFAVAANIARELGIEPDGYRVVTNVGRHGCQSVRHLHFHLLGGRQLSDKL